MPKGPQLQNIPKPVRAIFRAAPGRYLIQSDLRRAEAMYVAFDAQEAALIELFLDSTRDLYKEVAAKAMGMAIRDVPQWLREVFKRVVHAANYGMGPFRFITVLRLAGINIEDLSIRGINAPSKKSEYLIEGYHGIYRNIRLWQREITNEVRATRMLRDSFGRRRTFLDRMDDSLFRKAFSFKPQSSIVGVTNQGLTRLYAAGEEIVTQTHDSICTEVDESRLVEGAAALDKAMTHEFELHGRKFTIPRDIVWGENWGEMAVPGHHTIRMAA